MSFLQFPLRFSPTYKCKIVFEDVAKFCSRNVFSSRYQPGLSRKHRLYFKFQSTVCFSKSQENSWHSGRELSVDDIEDSTESQNNGNGGWQKVINLFVGSVKKFIRFVKENVASHLRTLVLGALALAGLSFWFILQLSKPISPPTLPYSEFVSLVKSGRVSEVSLVQNSNKVFLKLKDFSKDEYIKEYVRHHSAVLSKSTLNSVQRKLEDPSLTKYIPTWHYDVRRISGDDTFLIDLLLNSGVKFEFKVLSFEALLAKSLREFLLLLPAVVLMAVYFRSLMGVYEKGNWKKQSGISTTFDDVAGVDLAKKELSEVVRYLRGDPSFSLVGAKLPRGILLCGPPGTGKTLLARAVAGEARVPFFSTSASEFVEIFVGRGAARVRALFQEARKVQPSIIFIDELDALGGSRNSGFNEERDQALNQLLTELDGFDKSGKVLVLAATNRPEILDPALVRPGRISRKVEVGIPSEDGRKAILQVHMRGKPIEEDPEALTNFLSRVTQGFSGAGLASLVNDAALLAARRGAKELSLADFRDALERGKKDQNLLQEVKGLSNPFQEFLSWSTRVS